MGLLATKFFFGDDGGGGIESDHQAPDLWETHVASRESHIDWSAMQETTLKELDRHLHIVGFDCCASPEPQMPIKFTRLFAPQPSAVPTDPSLARRRMMSMNRTDNRKAGAPSYFDREVLEMMGDHFKEFIFNDAPVRFSSGSVYIGQWIGTERHGFGKQMWPDGAGYMGQWRNNAANGSGALRHPKGDYYIGELNNNQASGFGGYICNTSFAVGECFRYYGQWVDDRPEGFGVEHLPNSSCYKGEFVAGQKHGHGIFSWPDGSAYSGTWVFNHIDGYGKYLNASRVCLEGHWNNFNIHGVGRCIWQNGRKYTGRYTHGMREGFGVYKWPDGRKHEGYWEEGVQSGRGRLWIGRAGYLPGLWLLGKRIATDENDDYDVADFKSEKSEKVLQSSERRSFVLDLDDHMVGGKSMLNHETVTHLNHDFELHREKFAHMGRNFEFVSQAKLNYISTVGLNEKPQKQGPKCQSSTKSVEKHPQPQLADTVEKHRQPQPADLNFEELGQDGPVKEGDCYDGFDKAKIDDLDKPVDISKLNQAAGMPSSAQDLEDRETYNNEV